MRTVLLPETHLICVEAWRYLHCMFRNLTLGTCKLTVWKGFHWLQLILDLWCFFLSTTGSESHGAEVLMISFYPIGSAKPLKPGSSFLSLGTEASKHWSGMQGSPHFRCGLGQVVLKTEIRNTCSEVSMLVWNQLLREGCATCLTWALSVDWRVMWVTLPAHPQTCYCLCSLLTNLFLSPPL